MNHPNDETATPQTPMPPVEGTLQQIGLPPSVKAKIHRDQPEIPGYEFIKRLGKGGMGVVWLCKDVRAGRLVALKQTISDELSESDRTRFRTEAQAMAKLQHPNIVHVFEVNEHDGRPYFTMDYCPGGSLHDYLDRKPQPAKACAEIVEKLALGVQHAHENGIIHRDLKPANVLISSEFGVRNSELKSDSDSSTNSEERQRLFNSALRTPHSALLKLTDFGLAKNLEASQQFTRTESVMGTPSYMSPEQGTSTKGVGPSADVWSLGVILYECITGSLPFVGADLIEVLDNVRSKDPVPPNRKLNCPPDLETICLKCLDKNPRERYSSAGSLADDLRRFLNQEPILARPPGLVARLRLWSRRPIRVVEAGTFTIFLAIVLSLWNLIGVVLIWSERLPVPEPRAAMVQLLGQIVLCYLPLAVLGWWVVRGKLLAIWTTTVLAMGTLTNLAACLVGSQVPDFMNTGGLHRIPEVRYTVFSLLAVFAAVQCLTYVAALTAHYANRPSEYQRTGGHETAIPVG